MKEKRVHYTSISTPRGSIEKADEVNMLLTYQLREEGGDSKRRSLSYYSDLLSLYSKSNKIFSVAFPKDLVDEINEISQELGISRNKLIKIAVLHLLDGMNRLRRTPKIVYIDLVDVETAKRSLQSLLAQVGIRSRITKVSRSAKGSMLFIHLSDGRIIHLDVRERRGQVKKPTSYGLTTLEEFMVPEGVEIAIEG